MKLKELLQTLPLEHLKSFLNKIKALKLVQPVDSIGPASIPPDEEKDKIIQELLTLYESAEYCGRLLAVLPSQENQLLAYFLRDALWEAIPFRQMEEDLADDMAGMELKAAIIGLREKGVLFAFRKLWGEILYVLPRDISVIWHGLLFQSPHTGWEKDSLRANEVDEIQEASPGLHLDVYSLLSFIERYHFPLTQKGTVHKRQVQKCTEALYLQSAHLQKMTLRYMDQDIYPRSFAVVFDMALRLGLVDKTQEAVVCIQSNVNEWLDQTPQSAAKQLFEEWNSVHTPSRVWLQHVFVWMQRTDPGEWIEAQRVLRWLKENEIDVKDDQPLRWMEEELLQPLCGLGWLDLGRSKGERVFRWKPIDDNEASYVPDVPLDERDQFYVQPNFELMIPPTARLSVRWQTEQFADLKQSDPMSIYNLTKESLHHALEKGRTFEEIVSFLETYSRYELPPNVRDTISQWAEQYGRVRFIDAVLMRCADNALAQELESHPKLNSWIIEKVSDTDFLVRRDHVKECIQFLEKQGYAPKKEVETFDGKLRSRYTSSDNQSKPHRQRGIILSKNMLFNYQLDTIIPTLEEVVPSIKKLPGAWTQDYRHYHASTLRDLIIQAIELNTKIRWKNGNEEHHFIPKRLMNEGGTWIMEGRDSHAAKRQVTLEEIQNIQILIP
jgi:hypothetical protein